MSIRTQMTMTMAVERNTNTQVNTHGQREPVFTVVGSVPCKVWSGQGRKLFGVDRTMAADDCGVIMPLDSDVRLGDRVTSIVDRRGVQLFGKMNVGAVVRKATHLQTTLRRIDG